MQEGGQYGKTSGGSGFDNAVESLQKSVAADTVIKEGKLLNGRSSVQELKKWGDTL